MLGLSAWRAYHPGCRRLHRFFRITLAGLGAAGPRVLQVLLFRSGRGSRQEGSGGRLGAWHVVSGWLILGQDRSYGMYCQPGTTASRARLVVVQNLHTAATAFRRSSRLSLVRRRLFNVPQNAGGHPYHTMSFYLAKKTSPGWKTSTSIYVRSFRICPLSVRFQSRHAVRTYPPNEAARWARPQQQTVRPRVSTEARQVAAPNRDAKCGRGGRADPPSDSDVTMILFDRARSGHQTPDRARWSSAMMSGAGILLWSLPLCRPSHWLSSIDQRPDPDRNLVRARRTRRCVRAKAPGAPESLPLD